MSFGMSHVRSIVEVIADLSITLIFNGILYLVSMDVFGVKTLMKSYRGGQNL